MTRHKLVVLVFVGMMLVDASDAASQPTRIGGVTGMGLGDCYANAAMNANIVRTGFEWWRLQPAPGQPDWSYQDGIFQCFVSHGMKIYYTLGYAPDWAGGHYNGPPAEVQTNLPDINAWKQFVRDVIYHYSYEVPLGDNIIFGVWNEPEGHFLHGCPTSNKGDCWGQYLWLPAAQARDEVNPSARLAGPEMGTLDYQLDSALYWMSQSIRPQDVITTHWYPNFYPPAGEWVATVAWKAGFRETWLTETGINDCNDASQANQIDNQLSLFANESPYAYYWTTYLYYQVTPDPGDQCFPVHEGDPGFNVIKYWANYVQQPPQGPVLAGAVNFRASNGQFVVAEGNGNNIVNANRDVASTWETFYIWDLNGGSLQSGDPINIVTSDGWYFSAVDEGGSTLNTYVQQALTWEEFSIVRLSGAGEVHDGDLIAIQTRNGHYLVAESGGGDIVNANRTAIGLWETFTIFRQ